MKTFSISTLGCKVNQYESRQIRELLENLGLKHAKPNQQTDLVVVNTCCVTHTASAKSRRQIRRARKQCPKAPIVVAGCLPKAPHEEFCCLGTNGLLISYRNDLAATLTQLVKGEAATSELKNKCHQRNTVIKPERKPKVNHKNNLDTPTQLPPLTSFAEHTRAFLKVQDGCDARCSYCIVPKTRPDVRSKPLEEALQEAQALVRAGHKEIVVTGVFLGAYGQKTTKRKYWQQNQNDKLPELLDRMAEIPGLARIRLSSLEPADVTPRLLDTFSRHHNIMPHLHLSLQSGSDAVLKKMCRQYNADDFRKMVVLVKSRLDRPAITTDIIVGFPGETDDDFRQTVDLAKETSFAKMHIFRFSPRKGTAAANMQNKVDSRVINKRAKMLRDLNIELATKFRRRFIGQKATVLLENTTPQPSGRSERYFMVYLEKTTKKLQKADLLRVKLNKNTENAAIGRIIDR